MLTFYGLFYLPYIVSFHRASKYFDTHADIQFDLFLDVDSDVQSDILSDSDLFI